MSRSTNNVNNGGMFFKDRIQQPDTTTSSRRRDKTTSESIRRQRNNVSLRSSTSSTNNNGITAWDRFYREMLNAGPSPNPITVFEIQTISATPSTTSTPENTPSTTNSIPSMPTDEIALPSFGIKIALPGEVTDVAQSPSPSPTQSEQLVNESTVPVAQSTSQSSILSIPQQTTTSSQLSASSLPKQFTSVVAVTTLPYLPTPSSAPTNHLPDNHETNAKQSVFKNQVVIILASVILVVAFIIFGLLYFRWRRRISHQNENDEVCNQNNEFGTMTSPDYPQKVSADKLYVSESIHHPPPATLSQNNQATICNSIYSKANCSQATIDDPFRSEKYPLKSPLSSKDAPINAALAKHDSNFADLPPLSLQPVCIPMDENLDVIPKVVTKDDSCKVQTTASTIRYIPPVLRSLPHPAFIQSPDRIVLPNSPHGSTITLEKLQPSICEAGRKQSWTFSREMMPPVVEEDIASLKTYSWRSNVSDINPTDSFQSPSRPRASKMESPSRHRASKMAAVTSMINPGKFFIVNNSFHTPNSPALESPMGRKSRTYLNVQDGDPVIILQDLNDGWVMARTPDGQAGAIPKEILIRW